jgi:hypothetical protein
MQSQAWHLLILSLPTGGATARMRLWRGLKALGAAALRDGAYLLPAGEAHRNALAELAREAQSDQGAAWLLDVQVADADQGAALAALFDRSEYYAALEAEMETARRSLAGDDLNASDLKKTLRGLRRQLEQFVAMDFFPGAARDRATEHLADLERAMRSRLFPEEPTSLPALLPRLDPADFQGRTWATRKGLWVDRLASAWLIRRFIDPQARFRWLARIEDCPRKALGFDFDGGAFSHVVTEAGERVTFETLLASFGLEQDPALLRLGAMVHALDVGAPGTHPAPEAAGFELMLRGLKARVEDDDQLLAEGGRLLDDLYAALAAPGETN